MATLSNPKHEAFAQAFAVGPHAGNATAAYKAVYGKPNRPQASRLQHRQNIAQRVLQIRIELTAREAEANAKASAELAITKQSVLGRIDEVARRCMQHVAVLDADGAPIGEYKFEATAAIKALELLGKHVGLFVPTPEGLQLNVGVEVVDGPPRETRAEWEARRRRELGIKTNGHGKPH